MYSTLHPAISSTFMAYWTQTLDIKKIHLLWTRDG